MNELALIKQAKAGVTSSFSQLVAIYQIKLHQFLLARCYNPYDADDILQETFINAFTYIQSYKNKWAFSTWLFTIARRLLAKYNITYHKISCMEEVPESCLGVNDKCAIDSENIWRQIKSIIKQDAYDVLWFFYVEQLSIKEIAVLMQRSVSWVKVSLFRSKSRLSKSQWLRHLSQDLI